ncbi:MAG: response regulator transcription factor [Bacteroidota bacterium]
MKVLIIDNRKLAETIQSKFLENGIQSEIATKYKVAQQRISINEYDILIVDLDLTDADGYDFIRRIKKDKIDSGLIILSAKSTLEQKIKAFNLGADDFLGKPFFVDELFARTKALHKRIVYDGNREIQFNEIKIKPESHEVYVNLKPLTLTKTEYRILHLFIINKHRLLTKRTLVEHLRDNDLGMSTDRFIYTHFANLRKKITSKKGKDYIRNIYGMGYKFTDQQD